jgi:hypothetical protein
MSETKELDTSNRHNISRIIPNAADSFAGVGVYLREGVNDSNAYGIGVSIQMVTSAEVPDQPAYRAWQPAGEATGVPLGTCIKSVDRSVLPDRIRGCLGGLDAKTVKKVFQAFHKSPDKIQSDLLPHLGVVKAAVDEIIGSVKIPFEFHRQLADATQTMVRLRITEMIIQAVADGWVTAGDLENTTVLPTDHEKKKPAKKQKTVRTVRPADYEPQRPQSAFRYDSPDRIGSFDARSTTSSVTVHPQAAEMPMLTNPLQPGRSDELPPVLRAGIQLPGEILIAKTIPEDITVSQLKALKLEMPKEDDVLQEVSEIVLSSEGYEKAYSLHLVEIRRSKTDTDFVFRIYNRTLVREKNHAYWGVEKDADGKPKIALELPFQAFKGGEKATGAALKKLRKIGLSEEEAERVLAAGQWNYESAVRKNYSIGSRSEYPPKMDAGYSV